MLLNINKQFTKVGSNILKEVLKYNDNIIIDYNKHIPFLSLFCIENKVNINSIVNDINPDLNSIELREWLLDNESYKNYFTFISGNRTANNIWRSARINENLDKSLLVRYSGTEFGYHTLIYSKIPKYVLCVKKEYVYYIKLCILTGQEIEFNCFYLLINNSYRPVNFYEKRLYKRTLQFCKDYDIEITHCDLEYELKKTYTFPKITSIKELNDFFINIKKEYVTSKINTKMVEAYSV